MSPRPPVPGLSLAGVGALAVFGAVPALAWSGGLAPLVAAALVGGFLGAPVAAAEWRSTAADPARDVLAELALTTWTAVAAASIAAPFVAAGSWAPAVASVGAPFAGAVLAGVVWGRAALIAGLAVAAVAACWPEVTTDAAGVTAAAAPWDLLEPHVGTWREWLPRSVVLGLGIAGAGVGAFGLARRDPGAWRAPWAALGLGLAAAVVVTVRAATTYGADLGEPGPDPIGAAVGAAVLAVAGPAVTRRPALLLASAVWLIGPAAPALPFATTVLAPTLSAAVLARTAWTSSGSDRVAAAVGAAALATAVAAAGAWPTEAPAALAMGAFVVVVFWWIATRLALTPRRAA